MLLPQIFIILRDERDFSHSQVVISKVPSTFKVKCIFVKAEASMLLRMDNIESETSYLCFISFQKLYQMSNSAARPVKLRKSPKHLQKPQTYLSNSQAPETLVIG